MYSLYMVLMMLEMHIAKPLVSESSCFELEIATEKLIKYESPDIDQFWQN
jgi:hypothetical protein